MIYYNSRSKQLMNETLDFIKQVNCPLKVTLEELERVDSTAFQCKKCTKPIYDLNALDEKGITSLLQKNSEACVLFSFDHPDIKIL